jgi:hypothetical protein
MSILRVNHRTEYRYQQPVVLGPHRLMCRPRDSHDLRLLDTGLAISPQPSELRWMHDVFGNSIAIATFSEPADELTFESTFRAEHFPLPERTLVIDDYAVTLPLSYSASEDVDLGSSKARHYPDSEHKLDVWVKTLLDRTPGHATLDVLMAMIGVRLHLQAARGSRGAVPGGNAGSRQRQLPRFRRVHDGCGALSRPRRAVRFGLSL